jgi:hypothetical protein
MCELSADIILTSILHCLQENLVFDKSTADAAQDIRMDPPVIIDRHKHHNGGPDSLQIRILKMIIAPGRATYKHGLAHCFRPAVQQTKAHFRENL